ncbi:cadherin domain-containing protein, partial [Microvirga flavescens]|uniref:cadherin domain-containing protein n=1 Tax=Microvirga flavescens TaxID=2249811 RepID=UPI0018E065FE
KFEIVGNELRLKAGAVLDYETATSHTIKITVTDNHGASVTKSVTIHVGDVDENRAPTGVTLSRDTVDEGTTGLIATLTGVDPDTGDTFTYALAEDLSGKFEIVGNELRLKAGAVLDYETATSHTIKITVTDNHGASVTKSVTIHVGDVDENRAPIGVTLSRDTVDEGTTGLIATLTGVDPDTGDTFTYALAEDPSGKFEIVGNELRLKAGAVLDYETATSHTIKITVTDNHGASVTKSVTIHVGDVDENRAPANVTLNGTTSATINENSDHNTFIGVLSATDADGDTLTYAFAPGGDAGGLFVIDNKTKQIKLAPGAVVDYEALPDGEKYFTLRIIASDGKGGVSAPQTITIGIRDVNEVPTVSVTGTGPAGELVVNENAANGTVVGNLSVFDPDGDAVTYALIDNAGGRFKIVGTQIRVANGSLLDYEAADGMSHDITIMAVDAKGAIQIKTVTISVRDIAENRAPTGVTLSRDTVDEGITGLIATLTGVDPDTGDTFTYALAEDLSGKFEIVGNELRLKAGAVLDYETATSHTIKITVTDNHGASVTQNVTITLKEVDESVPNEAPSDISLSRLSIKELSATGAEVGTLSATDTPGDTFFYTLLDDAGGRFALKGDKIVVKNGVKLDYEQARFHEIRVKVTDQGNLSVEKTLKIDVSDMSPEFTLGTGDNDVIIGGAGKDTLGGGLGNDILTGGAGKDAFVFDTRPNKKTNFDTITDYDVKSDSIYLDNAIFTKLGKGTLAKPGKLKPDYFTIGSKAQDKNDYLIFNAKKGILYYDADGSGPGKAVEIATLKKGLKMTAGEFFVI